MLYLVCWKKITKIQEFYLFYKTSQKLELKKNIVRMKSFAVSRISLKFYSTYLWYKETSTETEIQEGMKGRGNYVYETHINKCCMKG